MSIEQQLQFSMLGRVGSFWSEQVDEETENLARTLVYRASHPEILQKIDATANSLAESSSRSLHREKVVSFINTDVIYVGPDIFTKWQSDLQTDSLDISVVRYDDERLEAALALTTGTRYLVDDTGRYLIYVSGEPTSISFSDTTYLIPISFDEAPMIIMAEDSTRTLVHGIDFVVGEGYLIFKESPSILFPNNRMIWQSYTCESDNYRDFSLRHDSDGHAGYWVQEYYRHSQSAYNFEKAVAEYAGLVVLREESLVLSVQPIFGGYRYITDTAGMIEVRYPHTPLHPGNVYDAGHVVDDQFKVFQKSTDSTSTWWLPALGTGRASLDGILPGTGCWVSNNSITVDYENVHTSGKVHARVHYEGSGATKSKAWEVAQHQESVSGEFLADHLGLSPTVPALQINLMQYIADFYGDRLLIVRLGRYTGNTEQLRRTRNFIDREKPIGALTLTIDV